jgi:hypothetical protein
LSLKARRWKWFELLALWGSFAQRLQFRLPWISHDVKRVVAARIASIRVLLQQNYAGRCKRLLRLLEAPVAVVA